jgi:hypothetical protein
VGEEDLVVVDFVLLLVVVAAAPVDWMVEESLPSQKFACWVVTMARQLVVEEQEQPLELELELQREYYRCYSHSHYSQSLLPLRQSRRLRTFHVVDARNFRR